MRSDEMGWSSRSGADGLDHETGIYHGINGHVLTLPFLSHRSRVQVKSRPPTFSLSTNVKEINETYLRFLKKNLQVRPLEKHNTSHKLTSY